jgi:hypothetical protein
VTIHASVRSISKPPGVLENYSRILIYELLTNKSDRANRTVTTIRVSSYMDFIASSTNSSLPCALSICYYIVSQKLHPSKPFTRGRPRFLPGPIKLGSTSTCLVSLRFSVQRKLIGALGRPAYFQNYRE